MVWKSLAITNAGHCCTCMHSRRFALFVAREGQIGAQEFDVNFPGLPNALREQGLVHPGVPFEPVGAALEPAVRAGHGHEVHVLGQQPGRGLDVVAVPGVLKRLAQGFNRLAVSRVVLRLSHRRQ
jgi:hypothetical protein